MSLPLRPSCLCSPFACTHTPNIMIAKLNTQLHTHAHTHTHTHKHTLAHTHTLTHIHTHTLSLSRTYTHAHTRTHTHTFLLQNYPQKQRTGKTIRFSVCFVNCKILLRLLSRSVQCDAAWCSVVQRGAVWCSVVQSGAVWCCVLQCGAVCGGCSAKSYVLSELG